MATRWLFPWVLVLGTSCAASPALGGPRGELVLGVRLPGLQLKSLELQHQGREHAESITGFALGDDVVRHELPAGPYCVERLVFDTGSAGGEAFTDLCFEVAAEGTTFLGTLTVRGGELVLVPDGARLEQAVASEEAPDAFE